MSNFGVNRSGAASGSGVPTGAVPEALFTAKGDLVAGTGASPVEAKLAVGANNTRLVADSAQTTGLKYVADTTNYAVAAKGDVLVGTAAQTVAPLAVGSDGMVLTADSTQTTGLKYATAGVAAGAARQSVLSATLDSNGYNNAVTTGAGLRPGLTASPTAMVLAMANSFGITGATDFVSVLSANVADILGADLKANNTAFLHATYVSGSAVTWGSTYAAPQYGYTFDRTKGALLNFEAADQSTTFLDDFGNTWARGASNTAKIVTAQHQFGTASLLLDGAANSLVKTTNITTLGDGSWEMSLWFRISALPTAGNYARLISAENSSSYGVIIRLFNNAGTTKLEFGVSSTGSSWDVVNLVDGTNTVWTLNQWNKVRLVFDALAGTYRVYLSLNGAAETQDQTTSSTARACAITALAIGGEPTVGGENFNGWLDAFRFLPIATNTTTETPSASAPTITDYPVHFFSIPAMQMNEVTAASTVAGTNPTMTVRNRLFVAECDTGAATVSAVRNYAVRGKYISADVTVPALGAGQNFATNLGVSGTHVRSRAYFRNTTAEAGFTPGQIFSVGTNTNTSTLTGDGMSKDGRNTVRVQGGSGSTQSFLVFNRSTGAATTLTPANWALFIEAERAF